jgi:hypothetical protein
MKNNPSGFDKVYAKAIDLLGTGRLTYRLIGGLATGVLGEARMTQDVDILIKIKEEGVAKFLEAARIKGFKFSLKKVEETIRFQGFLGWRWAIFM